MAIAFVAHTYVHNNATCGKPTGTAQNQCMVAMVGTYDSVVPTGPAGWTKQLDSYDGNSRLSIWTKIAGASEPSSYTWTGNSYYDIDIATFSGTDTTTPLDGTPAASQQGSGTASAPSVTASAATDYLYCCTISDQNGGSAPGTPSGMTVIESDSTDNDGCFYQALSSSGATGTKSFAITAHPNISGSLLLQIPQSGATPFGYDPRLWPGLAPVAPPAARSAPAGYLFPLIGIPNLPHIPWRLELWPTPPATVPGVPQGESSLYPIITPPGYAFPLDIIPTRPVGVTPDLWLPPVPTPKPASPLAAQPAGYLFPLVGRLPVAWTADLWPSAPVPAPKPAAAQPSGYVFPLVAPAVVVVTPFGYDPRLWPGPLPQTQPIAPAPPAGFLFPLVGPLPVAWSPDLWPPVPPATKPAAPIVVPQAYVFPLVGVPRVAWSPDLWPPAPAPAKPLAVALPTGYVFPLIALPTRPVGWTPDLWPVPEPAVPGVPQPGSPIYLLVTPAGQAWPVLASGHIASIVALVNGQVTALVRDGTLAILVRDGHVLALERDGTLTVRTRDGTVVGQVRDGTYSPEVR